MGRYTDLARKYSEDPQREGSLKYNINVNINNNYSNRDSSIDKPTSARPKDTLKGSSSVEKAQTDTSGGKVAEGALKEHPTTLRPTTLTTLFENEVAEEVWTAAEPGPRYTNLARKAAPVRCIHNMTADECAVCSGYVRWLIEDEDRLRRAGANPEAARREYRSSRGRGA